MQACMEARTAAPSTSGLGRSGGRRSPVPAAQPPYALAPSKARSASSPRPCSALASGSSCANSISSACCSSTGSRLLTAHHHPAQPFAPSAHASLREGWRTACAQRQPDEGHHMQQQQPSRHHMLAHPPSAIAAPPSRMAPSSGGSSSAGGGSYYQSICQAFALGEVAFEGDTLEELQELIDMCRGPTVIDLGGKTVELVGAPPRARRSLAASFSPGYGYSGSGNMTSYDGDEEDELWVGAGGGTRGWGGWDAGCLRLDRDGITLANGHFVLRGDASVRVSAHVAMRDVAIENPEGPDVWRPEVALADEPPKPLLAVSSGSLSLSCCSLVCYNQARHLLQSSGATEPLLLSYCSFRGGSYGASIMPSAAPVRVEFCKFLGYARIGLLVCGCRVDILGCLFRPSEKAAGAVTLDDGASATATGCFVEGPHAIDAMCTDGSRLELLGCKLGDAGSRSDTAIHLETAGRAVLRDCDLANAASVRGGRLALHHCNLGLAGGECAGRVMPDSILTVEGCASDHPVYFRAAKGAAVIISNSPSVSVGREDGPTK